MRRKENGQGIHVFGIGNGPELVCDVLKKRKYVVLHSIDSAELVENGRFWLCLAAKTAR